MRITRNWTSFVGGGVLFMKKIIEDYDLDVMNILKDFPYNENDSFLFIRGKLDANHIGRGFLHSRATTDSLSAMYFSFIQHNEDSKNAALNAVLNYFKHHKSEIPDFQQHLSTL